MKKILLSLLLVLIYVIPSHAQTVPAFTESCVLSNTATSCALRNEEGAGIGSHVLTWTLNGSNTGSTVTLQYTDVTSYTTLITGTTTSAGESSPTSGAGRLWRLVLSGFTPTSTGANVVVVHKAYNFTPGTASIGTVGIDQSVPGTTNGVVCTSGCGTGSLTNNNAAPGATNSGVLPGIANAAAPSYSEGKQVLLSLDLGGSTRTTVTNLTTDTADNAAFTENPVGVGCKFVVTPTDHTDGDKAVCLTDIKGNIGISPIPVGATTYTCVTANMTGTSDVVCGALVASSYIYLTSCTLNNNHASVGTLETFKNGSGGATLGIFPNPSSGSATNVGGATITFLTPLKVTTVGTALYVTNGTTSSSTYVSCSGYSSPVSY